MVSVMRGMIHEGPLKCQLVVEEKYELRQHVSSRYFTPVWSSSSGTIKRLVRFASNLFILEQY